MITTIAAEPTERSRRAAILTAAGAVFLRYGYRKTSMNDLAEAADVSRQGLYVHFTNKEELFREVIHHRLGLRLHDARLALADQGRPIGERLAAALNAWFGGRDRLGVDSDLTAASMEIAGTIIREQKQQLDSEVRRAVETSELMAVYGARGISATDIANTLMATCQGINTTPSDETFLARIRVAVAILTAAA